MQTMKEEILAKFKQVIEKNNTEFVDLEIKGSPKNPVFRVFVDVAGGVSINQCAVISRELNQLIESENMINTPYRIDVSSPGLDRPLQNMLDFARNIGRCVNIKYLVDDCSREISGKIINAEPDKVFIEYDDSMVEILYDQIASALVQIRWK